MISTGYETIDEVDGWATIRQLAAEKRTKPQNIYRFIRRHGLPIKRVGTVIFVKRSEVSGYDSVRRVDSLQAIG